MPADEEPDVEEMESENAEDDLPSYKQKYKELKSKLKCLVYEQECFESDIQGAQARLLELARDKSYLLDQLMRYEGVAISDDDETDYSSGDESGVQLPLAIVTQPQKPEPMPRSQLLVKHTQPSKAASTVTTQGPRQGATRGSTASQNPGKTSSGGPKAAARKSKPSTKVSANSVARITKTVARARQPPVSSSLVVSLSLANLAQKSKQATQQAAVSTDTNAQQMLLQAHVLHQVAQQLPNGSTKKTMPPLTTASSPSSSSSSSSSSSDSEDSGSESSSSSDRNNAGAMNIGGPVPIVTTAGSSVSGLVKPKAVTSPVKGPPQLIQAITSGVSSTPPPLLSPLTSPGSQLSAFSWSNRHMDRGDHTSSPSVGFIPIAPPLSSPPSSLPFSSFAKPMPGSAFHVVNPPNLAPAPSPQDGTSQ